MGRSPVLETGAGEVGHHLVASGTSYVDLVVDQTAPRISERSRVVDLVPDDVGLDERRLCQLLCAVGVAGEEPCGPQRSAGPEPAMKAAKDSSRSAFEALTRPSPSWSHPQAGLRGPKGCLAGQTSLA